MTQNSSVTKGGGGGGGGGQIDSGIDIVKNDFWLMAVLIYNLNEVP